MNIYKLIGRNIEITEAMQAYAEDKLARLNRFSDQIIDAKVVMSYTTSKHHGNPAKVEVQVNLPNGIIRAEERGQDTYAAIDLVVDKLERQLKKFKGRMLAKRGEAAPAAVDPALTGGEDEMEDDEPRVVRTKQHTLRPMAPEDAALQMEALGHTFFLFRNIDTDLISVIYLRADGNYGLLEPLIS